MTLTTACPICDNERPEVVGSMGAWTWLRCRRAECRHTYHVPLDLGEASERLPTDLKRLAPLLANEGRSQQTTSVHTSGEAGDVPLPPGVPRKD